MTTRIQSGGPAPRVDLGPTAARTTAEPARPFQQLMRVTASAIIAGAEQAATRLPGGSILAAAIRPTAGGVRHTTDALRASTSPAGVSSALGTAASASGLPGAAASSGSIEGVLDQNGEQNLYFLELQERISQENRTYTTLSNVLKARHETLKNAISNIR